MKEFDDFLDNHLDNLKFDDKIGDQHNIDKEE